ncbi:ABC transporter substrate-binding protein [Streptomyces verrucosisporus]|uniref:ABC transporter substrate-binding protein n=1 Tax=Streptomyces verrucosisporus TaxID=1695161 RepID=UPI0019CFA5B8|nr:ABC transporter substrate-binding protein [Streptomyces verrucosisporus]MBN3931603.1 ABC transporter substrate-binding protein [Streptomyces verrucosisporus]
MKTVKTQKKRTARTAAVVAATALALIATGCSSKAGGGDSGGTGADGVRTDKGVTDDTIRIGALTDMTGVYASLGKSVTQAQQLYIDKINADGGICGRKLELTVRDHGYDAGKAIPAYTELQPKVVGFVQFLGSPFVSAVKERIDGQHKVLVLPQAWSADLLGSEYIRVIGATYDVETVNAIEFLLEEGRIAEGDKLGHVYFEGDYGENALKGAEYAAGKAGLTLVEQKIKPTDEDMSAQVAAFKKAGVKAIVISAGPRQAASLVGVSAAGGLNVPIIGNNSAFAPQLLKTQAGPVLQKDYYVAASTLPIGSEEPEPARLAREYAKAYPDDILDNGVAAGWSAASVFGAALKQACDDKDLTREGVAGALTSMEDHDGGFGIRHDFTDPELPSTRETFILKPDGKTKGGLKVLREAEASKNAQAFSFGE